MPKPVPSRGPFVERGQLSATSVRLVPDRVEGDLCLEIAFEVAACISLDVALAT